MKNKTLKEVVREEFKRFGFEENQFAEGMISWEHKGPYFRSCITLDQYTNAIRFQQQELIDNEWIYQPFGVMAPLFEVIAMARDAYLISLTTRQYNKLWSESNIIPGTEGTPMKPIEDNHTKCTYCFDHGDYMRSDIQVPVCKEHLNEYMNSRINEDTNMKGNE